MLGRLSRVGLALRPVLAASSAQVVRPASASLVKRLMSETTTETPKEELHPTIRRQSSVSKEHLSVSSQTYPLQLSLEFAALPYLHNILVQLYSFDFVRATFQPLS